MRALVIKIVDNRVYSEDEPGKGEEKVEKSSIQVNPEVKVAGATMVVEVEKPS